MDQNGLWERKNSFSNELILLDGLTGSGKTMVMKIIDAFDGVSPPRFDYQLEQLCIAVSMGKLAQDAGVELLTLLLDQRLFDDALGRESNLRLEDLSSILRSRKKFKYLKKIFSHEKAHVYESTILETSQLVIVVHQLLNYGQILDSLPKKRVKQVICTRHPFYLFDHWTSYIEKHGISPRDFTITYGKDNPLPWFVQSYAHLFVNHSAEDKAAIAISELTLRQEDTLLSRPASLVIDFERFVLNPKPYLSELSRVIGSQTPPLQRVLKKQNLPRFHINHSNNLPIYRRYHSSNLGTSRSHSADYKFLREKIEKSTSKSVFEIVQTAAEMYEKRFGLWF